MVQGGVSSAGKSGGAGWRLLDISDAKDTAPSCVGPTGVANSANCNIAVGDTTDVGAYTSTTSFYGTFDQGGNLWEWNEALIPPGVRGLRGGGWGSTATVLASSQRFGVSPLVEDDDYGFRIARNKELCGDYNDDGVVGAPDLGLVLQAWGTNSYGVDWLIGSAWNHSWRRRTWPGAKLLGPDEPPSARTSGTGIAGLNVAGRRHPPSFVSGCIVSGLQARCPFTTRPLQGIVRLAVDRGPSGGLLLGS